ncbi:MAG: type II toxin-antitoxin system VapC family toxin [Chloroflexaceae bacterium]|nr:type II toxin-antitoxin system VapC family toxin [Chloroflexaceae bacterium]
MSVFFLDSSALVKRYLVEPGTGWIVALAAPALGHSLLIAQVTRIEVIAALAARARAGSITTDERDTAVRLLTYHIVSQYQSIPLDAPILDRAARLPLHHRLRGYDAIQLATALVANTRLLSAGVPALTFVAADNDLLAVARVEGLSTVNPNIYP